MQKYIRSTTLFALLTVISLPLFGNALFEYICDEKQLYKPYIHVYQQRKGPQILDLSPGFHDMSEYKNVYICVNGLAYLYFAKTETLSGVSVYEAPQLKAYAHTCEMYNVQPREGSATVTEVTLHLRAILLLGDPNDYRLPSIQKFTAPYYFRKDQLNSHVETDPDYEPQPPLYINASSVVIIGQSECTLSKGSDSIIKIRPHIFPPDPQSDEPTTEISYYCKIGFLPILDKASTPISGPVPSETDRAPALALINDEAIRVERCDAVPSYDEAGSVTSYSKISEQIDKIDLEYKQKKQDHLNAYNAQVDPVIKQLDDERTKLLEKKAEPKTRPREIRRLDKQLEKVELRLKMETGKKTAFEAALNTVSSELDDSVFLKKEADPSETKGTVAKMNADDAEKARKDWELIRSQSPAAPEEDVDAAKLSFQLSKRKARDSARDYQNAMSSLEVALLRLRKATEKVRRLSIYLPSVKIPNNDRRTPGKKETITFNPEGSPSVVITAMKSDCEKLPVLEGDEGECRKGKPDKAYVCSLFSLTLGVEDPWDEEPDSRNSPPKSLAPRDDLWKKEVLELIGDIFSTACDRIRNVKKFVTVNNRVMAFYLTNDEIFNMRPNPLTDTCINYRFTTAMKPDPIADMNFKEEKSFWTTLKFVLKQCKMEGRRLAFRENSTVPGKFSFVKNYGTQQAVEYDVFHHAEQADVEYSYNWAIDMNWKMFVTVMGVCMSSYETKIPLISSRFFSMYTEDFLIPLRETWVNPKDNLIFQFILSEYYNNAHTEYWMDMCMESSFIYAGQQDYRPPRTLMVNCHSENNYFVNGEFLNS